MKRKNIDKLNRAIGMLQGLSWAVEENCEKAVEGIWLISDDLEEIVADEMGVVDDD